MNKQKANLITFFGKMIPKFADKPLESKNLKLPQLLP